MHDPSVRRVGARRHSPTSFCSRARAAPLPRRARQPKDCSAAAAPTPRSSLVSQILALSDVKAQIKLRFCDEAGRNHVAIRSFQLSAGSGRSRKATLKTLDGVLVRSERAADGTMEKVTTQMRASALDEVLPQLLGLPRPILEHVVFCHQEDSTWPLQEGAALKQRFDDIFATTRYSKAMEEVKKRRKALHDDAVTSQGDLQRLRTLADEARRLGRENAAADAILTPVTKENSAFPITVAMASRPGIFFNPLFIPR